MEHLQFKPHEALREYVENIIILKINFSIDRGLSPVYKFVPTHTRFLCFYLHDRIRVKKNGDFILKKEALIIGPQLEPVILDLGKEHHAVIVALKPCSLFRLLGIPMSEIIDQDIDARLLMGSEIDELLDRLLEAKNGEQQNSIIQHYLMSKLLKLKPALPFDLAMLKLVSAGGNLSIDYVAAQSCLSIRQLERLCQERIGLSPKLYARMVRFSHAYKWKENFPDLSWTEISNLCGYYDQMHLIRDFKVFAGSTPGTLTKEDIQNSVRFQALAN